MKITEYKTERVKIKEMLLLPFNRGAKTKQADKLSNSISNYGILRFPVLIKAKLNKSKISYWIADGQHMIAALTKLDHSSVECIIIETEDIAEIVNIMATLNNVNLKWTLDNYVDAYSALSNKQYETLKAHKFSTGLNCAISAIILGEASTQSIKNGTFKATAKDADKVTADLIDVISFLGTNNSKFMKAFIKFRRSPNVDYNHKKFMQKLAQNKSKVKLVHDEAAMKEILINLYK